MDLRRRTASAATAAALLLWISIEGDARAGRPRARSPQPLRATAVRQSHASEGHVVDVRRASREITVRTARGAVERIVIPVQAAIRVPHGRGALDGIRAGMAVRVEGNADERGRIVAREVAAH